MTGYPRALGNLTHEDVQSVASAAGHAWSNFCLLAAGRSLTPASDTLRGSLSAVQECAAEALRRLPPLQERPEARPEKGSRYRQDGGASLRTPEKAAVEPSPAVATTSASSASAGGGKNIADGEVWSLIFYLAPLFLFTPSSIITPLLFQGKLF